MVLNRKQEYRETGKVCREESQSTREIVIKPIKNINCVNVSEKKWKSPSIIQRSKQGFADEIDPSLPTHLINTNILLAQGSLKPSKHFNLIEDTRKSSFSYKKFIIFQRIVLLLVILSLIVESVKTDIPISIAQKKQLYKYNLNILITIVTILLVISLFIRYVCLHELEIDQKKFYVIRHSQHCFADCARFIRKWSSLRLYLFQCLVIIPHPFFGFDECKLQIYEAFYENYLNYQVNNILSLCSLLRVYLVFRCLINMTMYSSPRSVRLCNHNGIDHDLLYSIKCLLQERPLSTIAYAFLVFLFTFSYGLRVSEGTLIESNPQIPSSGFEDIENCIWCILITMPTIGYGDYYPRTILGRLVIFVAAISGIILSSMLIVSLSNYLMMQPKDAKSHIVLKRLQDHSKLQKQASNALVQTIKLSKYLTSKNSENNERAKVKQFFISLKKKIDQVKLKSKQIKSMVATNNIVEEMNQLFQLFNKCLEDSFNQQDQLKQLLSEFESINKNRGSNQTDLVVDQMELMVSRNIQDFSKQ